MINQVACIGAWRADIDIHYVSIYISKQSYEGIRNQSISATESTETNCV